MRVSRRLVAASSALAIAGAAGVPATAGAAQIATTIPCIANLGIAGAMTLPFVGNGFTPNAFVTLRAASPASPTPQTLASVRADPAGNVAGRVAPPFFASSTTFEQSFNLIATDTANPANVAATTFRQVRFGFSAKPSSGRPSRRVRYTARGFLPGRAVYAHFRFRGKTRRNVRLGVATSPCGIVSRRMRLLPTRPRFGTWTVYMDQRRTYSRRTVLQARGTLFIRRIFR